MSDNTTFYSVVRQVGTESRVILSLPTGMQVLMYSVFSCSGGEKLANIILVMWDKTIVVVRAADCRQSRK